MQQIETVMNKAKGSTGKASFEGFEGISSIDALRKLTDYNEDKENERNKEIEEAKDLRDSALQAQDKPSSKDVINQAFYDYENGKISYDAYITLLNSVKLTSRETGEIEFKEDEVDYFIAYLDKNNILDNYLNNHRKFNAYVITKENAKEIESLDPELKEMANKAQTDCENGDLDSNSYLSLISGLIRGGEKFANNMVTGKFSKEVSEGVAKRLLTWWQHNTEYFVDRGMTLAFAHGGDVAIRQDPSKLAKTMRSGAKYMPHAVGSLMDFGTQLVLGEDVGDAAIKTAGHLVGGTVGGAAGTAVGALIGQTLIPIPGIGAVLGVVGATAGSMLFDWAYDNGLKEGIDKVGDAVSGFFGKVGSIFS